MAVTWHVIGGKFTHEYLSPPIVTPLMVEPYPPFWWYVDDGKLTNSYMADEVVQGAFANCTLLRKVEIPASVKYIGEYAFANTALTTVTIARDCTFFPTSFPLRCIIQYYDT